MDFEKFENILKEKDLTFNKLNKCFDDINKTLKSKCNKLSKLIFDYYFSNYLYYNYIKLNKTKVEIGEELNIPPSTIYNYIKKYNIKKDEKLINRRIVETMKKTCLEKYGVEHTGSLKSAHVKQQETLLKNCNGQYDSNSYPKLKKSDETKLKMKISQQNRRHYERLNKGDDLNNE